MNAIVSGRANGKTYELMQWFFEEPLHRRIVVPDENQARLIRQDYKLVEEREAHPEMIVTWYSITSGVHRGCPPRAIAVDNLEMIVGSMLGQMPFMVSFTGATRSPRELALLRNINPTRLNVIGEWEDEPRTRVPVQ